RGNRLRVYYPVVGGAGQGTELKVHAKLLVVDDRLLRVGSANLNNRSMGLDTECDLAIEGVDAASRRQITAVRNLLLAELLHCPAEAVEPAIQRSGSLGGAIAALNRDGRLQLLPALYETTPSQPVPGAALFDPDEK